MMGTLWPNFVLIRLPQLYLKAEDKYFFVSKKEKVFFGVRPP